jgi:serine/threonine protein kinase
VQAAMPRTDSAIDFDSKAAPFDQLKGIEPLAKNRRGHVAAENARHHLYFATDKHRHTSVLIKLTARPGLVYQENLNNEIASLSTINRSLPESQYFPAMRQHGRLPDGRVYLIVSFFAELPLATTIGKERIPGRTVTYIRTAMETARALGELHTLRIYHVDLNPMNILVRLEHGRPIIRIVDFESSYEWQRHSTGGFYNPPNTPGYAAPEITHQPPDSRSDVFSLAAVLYTMLAGYEWTWNGDIGRCVDADRDIDPDLRRILLRAVEPDPDSRHPSMQAFYLDLAAHLERIWPGRNIGVW